MLRSRAVQIGKVEGKRGKGFCGLVLQASRLDAHPGRSVDVEDEREVDDLLQTGEHRRIGEVAEGLDGIGTRGAPRSPAGELVPVPVRSEERYHLPVERIGRRGRGSSRSNGADSGVGREAARVTFHRNVSLDVCPTVHAFGREEHFHVIDVYLVEFFPGGDGSGVREGMLHPVAWERIGGVLVGVRTVVGKVHLPGELQGDLQGVFVYQVQPFGAERCAGKALEGEVDLRGGGYREGYLRVEGFGVDVPLSVLVHGGASLEGTIGSAGVHLLPDEAVRCACCEYFEVGCSCHGVSRWW